MSSSESEYDPREALDEIDRDIEALEATLRPLLASESSWRETLDSLGNMEQAKMNMIMAYGICDLVWIFLRLKGLDPADHPVMKELDRIKTYYIKVRDAENPPKSKSPSSSLPPLQPLARRCSNPPSPGPFTHIGTNKVDVAAAGRFIAAAIPRAQRLAAPAGEETTSATAESSSPSTPTPPLEEDYQVGKSSRFKIAHDALPEKLQTDIRHDQMQVVDDDMSADVPAAAAADETGETNKAATASKHKGKRVAAEDFLDEETPKKTMSTGVTAGGDKTRKKRKSTSKRS